MDKSIKKVVSQRQFSKVTGLPSLTTPSLRPTRPLQPQTLTFAKTFEKYQLSLKSQSLQQELKCLEWRSKTQFPVVKVLFYKLLPQKASDGCWALQLGIQNFSSTLQSLPLLPFFEVLYLLKESMIGFERLFDRFGSFEVNGKMVLVNRQGRCRVWFNENIALNRPYLNTKTSEQLDFKNKVIRLFDEKCISSTLSRQLFQRLAKTEKLIESISYIEHFSIEKKIVPPVRLSEIRKLLRVNSNRIFHKFQDLKLTKTSPKVLPPFVIRIRESASFKARKYTDCSIKPEIVKRTASVRNLTENTPKSSYFTKNPTSTCERKNSSFEINSNSISMKSQQDQAKFSTFQAFKKCLSANNTSQLLIPSSNNSVRVIPNQMQFIQKLPLYRTINQKPQQKPRKFCQNLDNPEIGSFLPKEPQKAHQLLNYENYSIKVSPSTPKKEIDFPFHRKKEINAKQALCSTPKYNLLKRYGAPADEDLVTKNWWLKRLDNLSVENFRDTVFSYSDGKETLAEHLTLAHVELNLLKNMGKELRGSLLINAE